jgi:ComF family protein
MAKHLTKIGFNPSNYNSITAVPIHSAKLRDRGYNQAGLLAQFLANYFKISFKNDIIYATGESLPQAKLDKISRVKNIKGLFYSQGNLENKKVILVDDIFTTGSTANECAVTLKQNGAKVTVLTLSKTTIY